MKKFRLHKGCSFKPGDIIAKKNRNLLSNYKPFAKVSTIVKDLFFFENSNIGHKINTEQSFEIINVEEQNRLTAVVNSDIITYMIDINNREDACTSSVSNGPKIDFKTELDAYKHAWQMMLKYGGKWLIYHCGKCNGIHIGKKED